MKRKIALILAMLTVCSMASCGSDANDDDKPFTLNDSKSSSDDADESSKEIDDEKSSLEDELSKIKELEESAESLAAETERQEEESRIKEQKALEEQLQQEEEQKLLEEERAQLESEVNSMINEESSSESSEASDGGYEMGTVNGNVYSSNFSGVTFNLPDNMVFADEEEIMSIMDISGDIFGDSAAALLELSKKTTIYDMMARDVFSGDNIQVMYENLALYGQSVADAYDVDTYLEAVSRQFSALESSGIKVTEKERSDIKLGDQNFTKVELETYYETYDFTTTQAYYIKKVDNYMLAIIITLGVDSSVDGLETYEKMFS